MESPEGEKKKMLTDEDKQWLIAVAERGEAAMRSLESRIDSKLDPVALRLGALEGSVVALTQRIAAARSTSVTHEEWARGAQDIMSRLMRRVDAVARG